jgi:hypothetical protein
VGGGVSINIPWFNGKKYRAAEQEAQGELSAAESDFVSAQTESLGLLRNQLEKIETLHHHLELYSDNLLPTARQTVARPTKQIMGTTRRLCWFFCPLRETFVSWR